MSSSSNSEKRMWDALRAALPFLLWAKEQGAICDDVIADVERQIAENRTPCAPFWANKHELPKTEVSVSSSA